MKTNVYHNGDDVFIAWKPAGFIAGCRGFALLRRRNGVEETVSTWVGFENDVYTDGERRASTNWPIQKYQWTDYMANPGDRLQYRVVPMVGPDKANLRADTASAGKWTRTITINQDPVTTKNPLQLFDQQNTVKRTSKSCCRRRSTRPPPSGTRSSRNCPARLPWCTARSC